MNPHPIYSLVGTNKENFLFAFLGAITAIIFALGFYSDFTAAPSGRVPASGSPASDQFIPYSVD